MSMERSGFLSGSVLLGGAFKPARISRANGIVTDITPCRGGPNEPLVVPGFVDLHCHGGGGADIIEGGDSPHRVAHARHDTAAFLATAMTAPVNAIEAALDTVASVMARQAPDEACILGVHLEGPFISPDQRGAQPPLAVPASLALIERCCRRWKTDPVADGDLTRR